MAAFARAAGGLLLLLTALLISGVQSQVVQVGEHAVSQVESKWAWHPFVNAASFLHRRLDTNDTQHCGALYTMPPPIFAQYKTCINSAVAVANLGIPGILPHIKAKCWCDLRMGVVVSALGCCSHPDFAGACQVQCAPDCQSADEQACVQECPALCYEAHYAPPTCETACVRRGCHRFLRCITNHSMNLSAGGQQNLVCHERDFTNSREVSDYLVCQTQMSHRSAWKTHNAAKYCSCRTRLIDATSRANCCNSSWGRDLCSMDCSVDCSSAEAIRCMRFCTSSCTHLTKASGICQESCMYSSGSCASYAVCPPVVQPSYPYLCENGHSALPNGCCADVRLGRPNGSCPVTCDKQKSVRITVTADPGIYSATLVGGYECFCEGCPTTLQDLRAKLERQVRARVHSNGVQLLIQIAAQENLRYPTLEMQSLMDSRNEKIIGLMLEQGSASSMSTDAIAQVNDRYLQLVTTAARNPKPAIPPKGHDDDDDHDDDYYEANRTAMLFGTITGLFVVLVVLFGCLLHTIRLKKAAEVVTIDISVEARPQTPNSQRRQQNSVVVGRPITTSDGQNPSAQNTSFGVPAPKGRQGNNPSLFLE